MPAKNCLSLSEKKNLQEALKIEENYQIRERIWIFLLLDEGKTSKEIAEIIGCSQTRVAY